MRLRHLARVVVRSRVVHFLAVGAALFALSPHRPSERQIHISRDRLRALEVEAAARRGSLDERERRAILTRAIEDEVLVHEARRLGLDRDDQIVRQRLVQRTLFLAEDVGGASRLPSEEQLRAFFDLHRDRYRQPASIRFVHVFASSCLRAEAIGAAVRAATSEVPALGDAFPLERTTTATSEEIAARFGSGFVHAIEGAPVDAWAGPVSSSYGCHWVRVRARNAVRDATFEEARGQLPLDWLIDKRESAVASYLAAAVRRYEIDVGGEKVTSVEAVPRTAIHAQSSAED